MSYFEAKTADFEEQLALEQPDFLYNGAIPSDNDTLDYVKLTIKGVRLG